MVGGSTSVPKIMLWVHRKSSSICKVGKPPLTITVPVLKTIKKRRKSAKHEIKAQLY
jgi:hypothetical protein